MKTFRRITLLGVFASAGIALAVCTGFSTQRASATRAVREDSSGPAGPSKCGEASARSVGPVASEASVFGDAAADFGSATDPVPLAAPSDVDKASQRNTEAPESATATEEEGSGSPPTAEPAPEPVAEPPLQPLTRIPPPPAATAAYDPWSHIPAAPLSVEPYPALRQQAVPPAEPPAPPAESAVPGAAEAFIRQQLAPPAAAAPAPAPVPPAAGAVPEANSATATIQETVNGEGERRLMIYIPDVPIREVLELLSEQADLNVLASSSVQGNVSATLKNVDVFSALDAVLKSTGYVAKRDGEFIFVGTPQEFEAMEQAMDKVGTRIYRPNYITAAELQALITPLLTQEAGVVSVSSPAETGIAADDSAAGGDAFAGAEVVVVRDYEAVLAEIDQTVGQVDVRPLQVAIEAMILSVKLDDETSMGVDFALLRDNPNVKFTIGKPPGALPAAATGGLEFVFLDSSLGAFLKALEEIKDTNVIATPRLLVLNKHRADIQIGRQEGYISTTATTETATTQSVEFLDTGTLLRLRPFITSDGIIRMEIHPELSSGEVKVKGDFTVPEKEVTQVTTNIMVPDGCTMIIGGLIREELVSTPSQVPFFGNLPLVGPAFRSTTEEVKRDEILVLITPRIVYDPEGCRDGNKAACEFHRRQNLYADKMIPLSKRSVGRRYFRLARNAWAAGDRNTALRFAEMAVHFDPLSREAIDLRSDIWSGRPYGDHTLLPAAPAGTLSEAIDGATVAPWLLNNLERGETPYAAPVHPLDRGRPGPSIDLVRPRRLQ
ncbi:MAG: hypothetical protein JXB62_23605 [Pirellulales bacterium]|nr:hypothetical protein [Pirellulales bacterium]